MGITRQQALDCFASDDLIGIGMEADAIRRALHPESVVTYTLDRTLDATTNLDAQIEDALDTGVTGIYLRFASATTLDQLKTTLSKVKALHPELTLQALTATEVLALASASGLSIDEILTQLRDSGLDSFSGDDTPILDATFTSTTCSPADWLAIHRVAHRLGIHTSASMPFGNGETSEQRINHLVALRELQQETAGFTAFTPIASSAQAPDDPTAVEYLKTLAISRLYLDNIPNIQASLDTQGLKVLQMGLRFGANDAGSLAPSDRTTEEDLRRIIRGAGFQPVQRDSPYRTFFLN
jgi:cyclic dehypoxanthinyl futalosine synthase